MISVGKTIKQFLKSQQYLNFQMVYLLHIDIYQFSKKGDIQSIDYDNIHCDPKAYTLMWSYSEPGWYINMQYNGERKTV